LTVPVVHTHDRVTDAAAALQQPACYENRCTQVTSREQRGH
jgi:hypothetical protein